MVLLPQPPLSRPAVAHGKWFVLALCVPLIVIFSAAFVWQLAACPKGMESDFVQEWSSARNYWTGQPIYEPLASSLPRYFGPEATAPLRVNAHPPAAVLLALPLAHLDYHSAWRLWNVLSLALLVLSIGLLVGPRGLNFPPLAGIPIAAIILASDSLEAQVTEGQLNLVLLALLVGAWRLDRSGRFAAAGSLVGLAAAIKLFPGLAIVYFLVQRRWSAVLAAALSFAAASALAAALFGPDVFLRYAHDAVPQFQHYRYDLANVSLTGLWSKALVAAPPIAQPLIAAPGWVSPLALLSGLATAVACGWAAWRADTPAKRDIALALTVVGMLLASPIVWRHSYVLLLFPLLVLWGHSVGQPRVRLLLAVAAAMLLIVRHQWICEALVPGFQALMQNRAGPDFEIHPVYLLTAFSYWTYLLVAILTLGICLRPTSESSALTAA